MILEKLKSDNIRDWAQRYQNTFGYYRNKDKKILILVVKVNADAGDMTFEDRDGTRYVLYKDGSDDIGFEFIPPKSHWYNTALGPRLVGRIAKKQYARGISPQNTAITSFGETMNLTSINVNFKSLHNIFDSKTTFAEALKTKEFVVSPQFAVNEAAGNFFLYDKVIGKVNKTSDVYAVTLDNPDLFAQEVKDAFNRNDLKVKVQ